MQFKTSEDDKTTHGIFMGLLCKQNNKDYHITLTCVSS